MSTLQHIFLSFLISGGWIATATWIAERYGSRVGGLLVNLPSNLLVSLVFIALLRGPSYAAQAAMAVPVGMAINSLYLTIFNAFVTRSLWMALTVGLFFWWIAALCFFALQLSAFVSLMVYVWVLLTTFWLNEKVLHIKTPKPQPKKWSTAGFVLRIVFSGTLVASVVAVSLLATPWVTGIFSTFPAVMTSSMVILTLTQGAFFARATSKILILSSANILVYAFIVHIAYPVFGVWLGTLCAYAGSVVFVILLYPFLRRLA